jgi:hypothetical protein
MDIKYDSTYRVKGDSRDLVLSSILEMAERKRRPVGETQYIDESDRLRIRAIMLDKGIKQADIHRECDVTASAVTLLLKDPIPKGKTRGCRFLPCLQKMLGIVITSKVPPVVEDKEATRRALRILNKLTEDERENWLGNGELLAAKR